MKSLVIYIIYKYLEYIISYNQMSLLLIEKINYSILKTHTNLNNKSMIMFYNVEKV